MNKFKFGDRVWHDIEPCGFGVVLAIENGECHVKFRSGTMDWFSESELTPATDWVKCADKSPPFNKYVLIWDGEDQDVDWLSDTAPNEFKESHITHWMPLPAPPLEVER